MPKASRRTSSCSSSSLRLARTARTPSNRIPQGVITMRSTTVARLAVLGLVAVAADARSATAALRVVTTTSDLAALAREVGGDKVQVDALGKGYQDPHFIEPKPSFILLV